MNLKFKLSLMFFIEVGTEIIVDSRAVLEMIQIYHIHVIQFLAMVIF